MSGTTFLWVVEWSLQGRDEFSVFICFPCCSGPECTVGWDNLQFSRLLTFDFRLSTPTLRPLTARRPQQSASRGVLEVDWPFFGELCRALALRVAREYQPEIVLGVAKAGVIPGVVVASIMQCDFVSMVVTREQADAEPIVVTGPPSSIRGRRVLVVDETCDTGSTMRLALNEVRALKPAQVKSAVSFKTGEYTPDFHAFETENFIILPWDREIIQNGELVMRPDYAARL